MLEAPIYTMRGRLITVEASLDVEEASWRAAQTGASSGDPCLCTKVEVAMPVVGPVGKAPLVIMHIAPARQSAHAVRKATVLRRVLSPAVRAFLNVDFMMTTTKN